MDVSGTRLFSVVMMLGGEVFDERCDDEAEECQSDDNLNDALKSFH
jgi:hypothetical protein